MPRHGQRSAAGEPIVTGASARVSAIVSSPPATPIAPHRAHVNAMQPGCVFIITGQPQR